MRVKKSILIVLMRPFVCAGMKVIFIPAWRRRGQGKSRFLE